MTTKIRYKIRNWSDYNQSLVNRGNLTIWFEDKATLAWSDVTPSGRYKAILGPGLRSRLLANQRTEARIGAKILNKMTHCGMPESDKV